MLGLACSSWHYNIVLWTIFTTSPTGSWPKIIIFRSFLSPNKVTSPDLPIYKLLYPQTSYTLRILKANLPLGWYGPSYGPLSLARHGSGTYDSAFTHWIRQQRAMKFNTALNSYIAHQRWSSCNNYLFHLQEVPRNVDVGGSMKLISLSIHKFISLNFSVYQLH